MLPDQRSATALVALLCLFICLFPGHTPFVHSTVLPHHCTKNLACTTPKPIHWKTGSAVHLIYLEQCLCLPHWGVRRPMKTTAVVRAYLGEGVRRAVSKLHWCTCLPREGVSAAVSEHNMFLPVFKLQSDVLLHHFFQHQFRYLDIYPDWLNIFC